MLKVDNAIEKEMLAKHPVPEPVLREGLLDGEQVHTHPVFFDALNGDLIRQQGLRTSGSAGVSQQEDNLWHKMLTAHRETSADLAHALAQVGRRLATEYVDPASLEAFLANRGIAIDKNPGFRPVGVGEMARRIIGKAVVTVTGQEAQKSVGSLQLCAGQPAGVEAAIHSMRGFLDADDSDGILLIDADNAFNRINRAVALWNVQFICPHMKHVLINFYRFLSRIFINSDGFFELSSQEGTTQGCPLATAMFSLALVL